VGRNLALMSLLLFLLSGCAALANLSETSDKEVAPQPAATEALPTTATQTPPMAFNASAPAEEPVKNESSKAPTPNKNLSKEQVQLVQELLKASGYDPGPIDGILGPKTRLALQTFKSGCTTLEDLLGISGKQVSKQTGETQTSKVSIPANKNPDKEEVRALQERLKASGFYPGPIDGIFGAKTRLALQRYQASHGLPNSRTPTNKL
jgi:peptidoglycan hydrolase-like protein with peptidoglycan-binding domain